MQTIVTWCGTPIPALLSGLVTRHSQASCAPPEQLKRTALHVARARGHSSVADALLEHGANAEAADDVMQNATPPYCSLTTNDGCTSTDGPTTKASHRYHYCKAAARTRTRVCARSAASLSTNACASRHWRQCALLFTSIPSHLG